MINEALEFLRDQVNTYLDLKNGTAANEDLIVISNVSNNEGVAAPEDKLIMSLVNIEEEKIFKEQQTQYRNAIGQFEQYNPEIKLNLYVLICANFPNAGSGNNYAEGLKQLSRAITFFQGKNVFTHDNSPDMVSTELKKLVVELYSYSFEQQYNFWSILGAKYMPSALYKVRLLAIQDKQVQGSGPGITNITINAEVAK